MSEAMKTFKVICAHCGLPFHVRYALVRADAEGKGEVIERCQFCSKEVKIEIPRIYIREDHLLRGIKSVPYIG